MKAAKTEDKSEGSWKVRPEYAERRYRRIDTRLWNDRRVRDFSPTGKLVWAFLLSAPTTTCIPGLFPLTEQGAASALGLTLEGFREGFLEPLREGLVEADWVAGVVWLRKAVRYEWPTGPNVVKSWRRVVRSDLPECALVARAMNQIREEYQRVFANPEPFLKAFDEGFPEGFEEPIPNGYPSQDAGCRMQDAGSLSCPPTVGPPVADDDLPDATDDAELLEAPPRPELRLTPPDAPKAARTRKQAVPKSESRGDPRHHPLGLRLCAAFQQVTGRAYGYGGVDAKCVTNLLALADQDPRTTGEQAGAEIERRWRIGLAWVWKGGEKPVQTLRALVRMWNDCGEPRSSEGRRQASGGGGSSLSVADMPAHVLRNAGTHHDTLLAIGDADIPIPR